MNQMSLANRAVLYKKSFPYYPALHYENHKIYGVWMIGNDYRNATDYYGAYPHSYLKRIMSLFPDIDTNNILHLFSGSLDEKTPGVKLDVSGKNGAVTKDAEKLSGVFSEGRFELILADPPYSVEDAEHYGTPMISRNKVVYECAKVLVDGGFLVWLDQVFPMFNKKEFDLVGTIGLIRSTNHRVRCVFIFRKCFTFKSGDEP